jgi:ABC-type molybdate transport system substrate-binding protein
MNNAITYTKSELNTDDAIYYTNNEVAFINKDYIASYVQNSSAIQHWAFHFATKELVVLYKSSDTHYHYEGVPFQEIFALMSADSLGSFIAKTIKPTYSVA